MSWASSDTAVSDLYLYLLGSLVFSFFFFLAKVRNGNKNNNFYYLIIWVRNLGGTHFSEFSVPNYVNGFVC